MPKMTTRSIYLGTLPPDDPIYTDAGWKFIMNPRCRAPRRTEEQPPEDEAPLSPTSDS